MQDSICEELIEKLKEMWSRGVPLSEIERYFHSLMDPKDLHIELMNLQAIE